MCVSTPPGISGPRVLTIFRRARVLSNQEQEFEVQQRLHSEMLLLESRADARLRGEVTSGASAADDKAAYDKLQQQLRALEATGVLMPQTDRLGMPRQMSRGSLLPMADSASGVHLRL